MNLAVLSPSPPSVKTQISPVVAFAGIVAVICVSESTVKVIGHLQASSTAVALREAFPCNHDCRTGWPAGRSEALDLRRHAKFRIAGERAAGLGDGHETCRRSSWDGGSQGGVGLHGESGGGSVKRNRGSSS